MGYVSNPKIQKTISVIMLISFSAIRFVNAQSQGGRPVANAGLSRYAGSDPIVLDGTGSYDPDESGPLSYSWQQISGPMVVINDASTATPTISGFVQTEEIQECEFELFIRAGELESEPDSIKIVIVPTFTPASIMVFENEGYGEDFDPQKPTVVYFGGGGGDLGMRGGGGPWGGAGWREKANVISFDPYYMDPGSGNAQNLTFSRCADMIIVFLSAVAPDYKGAIQTMGLSLGGVPAIDVALRLNKTYADARYAVNRVSFLDASTFVLGYDEYRARVADFLANPVEGEQCWLDSYDSWLGDPYPNVLNVSFEVSDHLLANNWYLRSLTGADMNVFNNGVVAGAYWSVAGPGRNLQLASTPEVKSYNFIWRGDASSGYMDFFRVEHPGKLPEPVTLVGPEDGASVDVNGVVLSCKESENAIGYQLLIGSDPYHTVYLLSDTPSPPAQIITSSPFEQTWWTVKAYDKYGSTIYADPIRVNFENTGPPIIENISTGKSYGSIQLAIDDADSGDEIIVSEGIYQEHIDFRDKNLTVTSKDPNDSAVVAATVIDGIAQGPVVTLPCGQGSCCVLAGLTITGGTMGISCSDASPTIRNCSIESTPVSIEFIHGFEPTIINCTIQGYIEVYDPNPDNLALWEMDETDGNIAYDSFGVNDGICENEPVWQPGSGMVGGALQFDGIDDYVSTDFVLNPSLGAFTVLSWVKGGAPGQVIISQSDGTGTGNTWLGLDAKSGTLMTGLVSPSAGWVAIKPLVSESIISDHQWHHIGFVWDGSYRILYANGIEVAKDTAAQNPLKPADGVLYIGAGKTLAAVTFFSGLIDDVRIYNKALNEEEIAALAH